MKEPFNIPILFLVFNRPDVTQQVFDKIREVQPSRLYIAADGPRKNKIGEAEKCKEVRNIVSNIDWECELVTLFRDENLGCGLGPSQAITWFFDQVEEGIILEDDCLPSSSFFFFCEQMLDRYRDNKKVFHISGNNWYSESEKLEEDYYFTSQVGAWGWATWADRWKTYKFDLEEDIESIEQKLEDRFKSKGIKTYHKSHLYLSRDKSVTDAWDYQWNLLMYLHDGLAIAPKYNLVSNIGFIEEATHTNYADDRFANKQAYDIDCKRLIHPKDCDYSRQRDEKIYKYLGVYTPSFLFRLKRKLKTIVR